MVRIVLKPSGMSILVKEHLTFCMIDKINSIPVQDKDSLSELLAQGNEVKDNNAKKEAIEIHRISIYSR